MTTQHKIHRFTLTGTQKRAVNALMFKAIAKGDFEAYEKAVWGGADVHARLGEKRLTTMMVAADGGHVKIGYDLNSRGVSLNSVDADKKTAVDHAKDHVHMKILLENGFRLTIKSALRNGFHHVAKADLKAAARHLDFSRQDGER